MLGAPTLGSGLYGLQAVAGGWSADGTASLSTSPLLVFLSPSFPNERCVSWQVLNHDIQVLNIMALNSLHLPSGSVILLSVLSFFLSFFLFFFFFFFSLSFETHLQHMEVPRLGVELELQLLACSTATATQNLSCICDRHHSSQ